MLQVLWQGLVLSLVAIVLLCGGRPAPVAAQTSKPVWLNTRSGVYHCPDGQHYGRTSRGRYLPEAEAIKGGYRPAGGQPCSAALSLAGKHAPIDVRTSPTDPTAPRRPAPTLSCTVERVVDGDTLICREHGRVRMIGIDAPEMSSGGEGRQARAALETKIKVGSVVGLTLDAQRTDRYRRLLAYVWSGPDLINWVMVRTGWARVATYPPNVRYVDNLIGAERQSRIERRGFW